MIELLFKKWKFEKLGLTRGVSQLKQSVLQRAPATIKYIIEQHKQHCLKNKIEFRCKFYGVQITQIIGLHKEPVFHNPLGIIRKKDSIGTASRRLSYLIILFIFHQLPRI
ncbi:Hypothetical_protein [Hexamita inflata]|uniref:Hypothetical_protein n=1 Tax=Hexamita inflata TaxID=28002 RepID=A0ABP1HAL3_9EUKA